VFSGVLKVHQDALGRFVAGNGHVYPIKPGLNIVPSLTPGEAVAAVLAEAGVDGAAPEPSELVIVDPGWYGDPPIGAHLAYYVVLAGPDPTYREAFFVDAQTGVILDRWSLVHDARWRSIHDATAGSDCCFPNGGLSCDSPECVEIVCEQDASCCEDEWDVQCARRAGFFCGDLCVPGALARTEGDPPTGVADIDAAYDLFGDVYDYFDRAFGRDGIDDAGLPLVATVQSVMPGCPNAFWTPEASQGIFCPGTVIDDIVAHEVTHGLTYLTASLIYQNQPGQLNESFSDVFGELIDLFNGDAAFPGAPGGTPWPPHPTGPGQDAPNQLRSGCSLADDGYPDGVRWLVGEDALAFGGAIRDMWDPTCEGDPDRGSSPLQVCDIFDGGGVHSGSGIPNHAFALATDGGTFNGYTIDGIGPIKAGAVWYRALTTYLTVASDFQDAYVVFNQSAADLIGTFPNDPRTGAPSDSMFTAADAAALDAALKAVEMDQRGRCGWVNPVLRAGAPGMCTGAEVVFADDFEGASGAAWTTFNSEPDTPYDWVVTDGLPFDRPGSGWFCSNGEYADCSALDESATHTLQSPPIALPPDGEFAYLSFSHYMECEPGFDGGRLSIRVNGDSWEAVPVAAFEFNPYNATLRSVSPYGNTNPMAGQEAWTGVGGHWGTSVVRLYDLAGGGDTVEFRFEFGKDVCTGVDGWYLDDFVVYVCPDCNRDGVPDHRDFFFTAFTGSLTELSTHVEQGIRLVGPPRAASDVTLSFTAVGDFSGEGEFVNVKLNGTSMGAVFDALGTDCPATAARDSLIIPQATFNALADGGYAWFTLSTSLGVSKTLCPDGMTVTMHLAYEAEVGDVDENGVLDVCEGCRQAVAAAPEPAPVNKNRYVSFVPANAGRLTALRVTLAGLPTGMAHLEGANLWVGAPSVVTEAAGRSDLEPPVFTAAPLGCEPVYVDWGAVGLVHVFGEVVVPGARYEVQAVDFACGVSDEGLFSPPLSLVTARWGDAVGWCGVDPCTAPDGRVDITTDVTAVIDKFTNRLGAPSKTRTDLAGAVPNGLVDIEDVVHALDAFLGSAYPFVSVGEVCP
jgi:Zn-dependent metalloprotease